MNHLIISNCVSDLTRKIQYCRPMMQRTEAAEHRYPTSPSLHCIEQWQRAPRGRISQSEIQKAGGSRTPAESGRTFPLILRVIVQQHRVEGLYRGNRVGQGENTHFCSIESDDTRSLPISMERRVYYSLHACRTQQTTCAFHSRLRWSAGCVYNGRSIKNLQRVPNASDPMDR